MLGEKRDDPLVVLIKAANLVDQSVVDQALIDAERLGISVDLALVMSGHLGQGDLDQVLEAHHLVEVRSMSLSTAIKAIRLATNDGISLKEALNRLKDIHKATTSVSSLANDLTEMMLQSGFITSEQLGDAIIKSSQTDLLIGQVILLQRFVTTRALTSCLNACLLKRDMVLETGDLIEGLKRARETDCSLEQALFELDNYRQPVNYTLRLGDLLVMSGLINESDLLECTELEITKKKSFAQVAKEQGLVTPENMEIVVQVQSMVTSETLKPYMAAGLLRRVINFDTPLYEALAEVKAVEAVGVDGLLRLGDLLVESGIAEQVAIEKVLASHPGGNVKVGKLLLDSKILRQSDLIKALRLQSLWRYGYVSRLAAVKILKECYFHREDLERSFVRMGVYLPTSMQWSWV